MRTAPPLQYDDRPPEVTPEDTERAYERLVATALGDRGTPAQQQAAKRAIVTLVSMARWCAKPAGRDDA